MDGLPSDATTPALEPIAIGSLPERTERDEPERALERHGAESTAGSLETSQAPQASEPPTSEPGATEPPAAERIAASARLEPRAEPASAGAVVTELEPPTEREEPLELEARNQLEPSVEPVPSMEGSSDGGSSDGGSSDEGRSDGGSSDEDSSDEDSSGEGSFDEGSSDEGRSAGGSSDEDSSDEGAFDEGASEFSPALARLTERVHRIPEPEPEPASASASVPAPLVVSPAPPAAGLPPAPVTFEVSHPRDNVVPGATVEPLVPTPRDGSVTGDLRELERSRGDGLRYALRVVNGSAEPVSVWPYALADRRGLRIRASRPTIEVPAYSRLSMSVVLPLPVRGLAYRGLARLITPHGPRTLPAMPPASAVGDPPASRARRIGIPLAGVLIAAGIALAVLRPGFENAPAVGGATAPAAASSYPLVAASPGSGPVAAAVPARSGAAAPRGTFAFVEPAAPRSTFAFARPQHRRSPNALAPAAAPEVVAKPSPARAGAALTAKAVAVASKPATAPPKPAALPATAATTAPKVATTAPKAAAAALKPATAAPNSASSVFKAAITVPRLAEPRPRSTAVASPGARVALAPARPRRSPPSLPVADERKALTFAARSGEAASPIELPLKSPAGAPIVIRVRRHDPGLAVALVDSHGKTVRSVAVPEDATSFVLTPPPGSGPLTIVTTYSRAGALQSEVDVVR